jgi:hypothetical protein
LHPLKHAIVDQSQYQAAGYDQFVRQRFTEIIAQEQIHVATIEQTITQLGGTPNGYCNYSFPVRPFDSLCFVLY